MTTETKICILADIFCESTEWIAVKNFTVNGISCLIMQVIPTFISVQSLICVQLFATPWTAACQASLSITSSRSFLKRMSIKSVMPSNHLILCQPLLPPSIFPSIRVFSSESVLHIRWPKYWSFSISINPSNEYSRLIWLKWYNLNDMT